MEIVLIFRQTSRRPRGHDRLLPDEGLGRPGRDDREPTRRPLGAGQVRLPGELQRRLDQRRTLHRRRRSAASQVKTFSSV